MIKLRIVILIFLVCFGSHSVQADPSRAMTAYDDEIYSLAYKTFLANRNLKDAFTVAEEAVRAQPDDLAWRGRLAQIATWTNKPALALQQWLYIGKQGKNLEAVNKGIALANMLYDYASLAELFRLKVALGGDSESGWSGYIAAEEALGDPQKAISELRIIINKEPKLVYYEKLAALYRKIGNIKAQGEVLNAIERRFGVIPGIALLQAEILYSQGKVIEARTKLTQAVKSAASNDVVFWRTYGELSWLTQDWGNARMAYEKLNKTQKIDQYSLANLTQLLGNTNPNSALQLALIGWEKYKTDFFLLQIMAYGPAAKDWPTLNKVLSEVSNETKARLAKIPNYYEVLAKSYIYLGKKREALLTMNNGIKALPDSIDLKSVYVWMLIDNEYKYELAQKLYAWRDLVTTNTNFASACASGYTLLNNPEAALKIYQFQFSVKQNDFVWLMDVADALTQANRQLEAYAMHQLALQVYQSSPLTPVNLNNFVRLVMNNASGDLTAQTMAQLAEFSNDTNSNTNLMTWALNQNNYLLSEYVFNFYGSAKDTPLWIQHSIAINNNDKPKLMELLDKNVAKLPYRDRVVSATRIGNQPLAQTLAYQGLAGHPDDSKMYKLFAETMLPESDNFTNLLTYTQFGFIAGPSEKAQYTDFVTPRLSISPWISTWRTRSKNSQQILSAAYVDSEAGIKVTRQHQGGTTIASISDRRALTNFITLTLADSYRMTSQLNWKVALGYKQLADDTEATLIAAMKNEAKLGFEYQINPRDSIFSNLYYEELKSQDNIYLGNGEIWEAYLTHKFQLTYPDWNVRTFATVERYHGGGSVSNTAATIIPAAQTPATTSFFVPTNSFWYGIGFGFGEGCKEAYTHAWRPYAGINIFNDAATGLGSNLVVGIAGMVFGRDHLTIYYMRSANYTALNQINYIYGISYRINF